MSLRDYEMVMKAVADPTRVRILKLLEGGDLCACQIVSVLELSQSTVSKHFFLLRMAGLVKERPEKKWVHHSLNRSEGPPYARKILHCLKNRLDDDPVIGRDRKREVLARELGPENICERGMRLPVRRAASCCPVPHKEATVSREPRPDRHATGTLRSFRAIRETIRPDSPLDVDDRPRLIAPRATISE